MVAATLFGDVEEGWSLAGALQKLEYEREMQAATSENEPGVRSVTRASLLDIMERPTAGPEFEQFEQQPDGINRAGDFGQAADLAAEMMRKAGPSVWEQHEERERLEALGVSHAPQVSNTGGMNSHRPEKGRHALLDPREYLIRPTPKNFVELQKAHWTESDPQLFKSLAQGGGGIDWLTATIYGSLNERGRALVRALKEAKKLMATKDGVADRCAEVGLALQTNQYREFMIFHHPFRDGKTFLLKFGVAGKGRSYQPLIVDCDGITITFGRLEDSEGPNGTRGPVATVQITGITFLRLGEKGAFSLAKEVVESFGIVTASMRASRIDVCADLPGANVGAFAIHYLNNQKFTKAKGIADIKVDQKGRVQTFGLNSGAVKLRIYDKVQECLAKDPTGERMDLMIQNRWGSPQKSAVRVEFQFNLGKNRAKKYHTFRECYEGMADLIGWVTNEWFRLVECGDDRTHAGRYKGPESMCDEWLRTLHAFAFWSGRLDFRHIPPRVQTRPVQHLINGAIGTFAAALGRAGIVPSDDVTAFGILAAWKGPNALAERCREKALQYMASHGVTMRTVEASYANCRSTEDEREFLARKRILEAQHEQQRGPATTEKIPF